MASRSLHRVLTSDRVAKYATIGKFLGSRSTAQLVTSQAVQSPSNPIAELDPNLDLLDSLVAETLANSQTVANSGSTTPIQVAAPARAKELLVNTIDTSSATTVDSVSESGAESGVEDLSTSESQEVQELSKELQEVSKETKEQREQALIKEKQQAINDLAAASATPIAITDKPVVVLPITAKSREEAKFKSTKYSVKWLWEWSQKIIKMFAGAVVYKEEVDEA